jgi:hypothetical protein
MRWQYTKALGRDIGSDADVLGPNSSANKDALIWKLAEINAAEEQTAYGSAYTAAMTVLKNLTASQAAVDSALETLNNGPGTDPGTDPGSGGGGGGTGGGGTTTPTPAPDPAPTPAPDPTPTPDPDSPNASGDEIARIAEPTFTPPAGIEAADEPRTVTEAEMKGLMEDIGLDASLVVGADGSVSVGESSFKASLSGETASLIDGEMPITPLPVFRAGVSAGKSALVALKVKLNGYAGKTFDSVAVLKMKRDKSVDVLDGAGGKESLKPGAYLWTNAAGGAIASSDKVAAEGDYFMSVVIRDGSAYDLDPASGTIVDPLALAAKKPDAEPAEPEEPDESEEPDEKGGDNASGGGGGCDAGLGMSGAFASAAAFRTSRRRRKQHEIRKTERQH